MQKSACALGNFAAEMSFRLLMIIGPVLCIPLFVRSATTRSDPVRDPEPAYTRIVEVEPSRAKGVPAVRIILSTDPMQRTEFGYESTYSVKVVPFFFFNETGSIRIDLAPGAMELLGAGQVISFTGEAVNQNNARRLVEGRSTPTDAKSGRIRLVVKVYGIELIFKTTYRFTG
jgi:hypothetical protein